ncbi:MAG: PEP-CTERM sorting domain-containing protein [Planctomycetota bacterium]
MHTIAKAACAATLIAAGSASASINYDVLGFEVPSSGFNFVGLEGQGGGSPDKVWQFRGTSNSANATVASTIGVAGTDGVQFDLVDQPGAFDNGDYGVIIAPDVVPDGPVEAGIALNVLQNLAEGPIFGFTVFGSNSTPTGLQSIAGEFVVDPSTGEVFVNSATPFDFVGTGTFVPLSVYNDFDLVLDYTAKEYDLFVNGGLIGTFDFRAGQTFGDVDGLGRTNDFRGVTFLGFDQNLSAVPLAGTAYYDNLVVVPEPAVAGLVGLAGLFGLRRKR